MRRIASGLRRETVDELERLSHDAREPVDRPDTERPRAVRELPKAESTSDTPPGCRRRRTSTPLRDVRAELEEVRDGHAWRLDGEV